ncbi:uncharacterized protein LOC105230615 [Bactrocera dorsalis]|uniref:Uncharacterized protein LOC105230615 n=1 Tax=Bactrocera dorsalis TaxID=27457 RepID=A0A6I9VFD5_BACDO|nr:uncharacterized protein LOC105230615 [Bactrocera dorsalis]
MEELPNDFSASSSVLSSAEPGSINSVEDANCNQAIITSGSQQQQPQDSTDILFKEFSVDMHPGADSNTEIDRDSEEDLGSLKNNIANACAKKPSTAATKSKSKSKLKCKSKTKPKSKPGFFQRLKESFSSIFKKPQAANSKDEQIKKPALSSDYANYFVKYLAHRDMNTDANNLSVNDLNSRYVGIKSSGNSERVGKGLHRREYNSKDLNSKVLNNKISTFGDLSDKEISLQTKNDISFEKFSDEAVGKKDSVLKEFPFQDFNFGDLNLKKLSTKDIRSNNKADDQFSDLENFKSKDEEVNKIVHSLAEQQSTAKDPLKNEKWETKDDSSLKELALPKDSENLLLENNKLIHEDYKDHNMKETVPIIAGKSIEEVIGNGKKEMSSKNEVSNELTASSFSMRRPNFDAKDDTSKLLSLKDFDFSFPDLDLRSLASTSKDIISKDDSFDDFANLGMSSPKMKMLESNGEEIDTPTDIESSAFVANEDISKESDVNEYGVRKSDDTSLNIKSHNYRVEPGLAEAKQTKINGFVLGDLSAISDKNNLDLDRQFTRQVLEKVMRSTVQEHELNKQ